MGFLSSLFKKDNYEEELKKETSNLNIQSEIADLNNNSCEFSFEVEDVFSITGRGTIVTGKVLTGCVRLNDMVQINGITTSVIGIEMFRKALEIANAGESAGLLLKDISRDMINRGDIIRKC